MLNNTPAGTKLETGITYPLGATRAGDGFNFAIVSAPATAAELTIYVDGEQFGLTLDPSIHRTGAIWHVSLAGLRDGFDYSWRFGRPSDGTLGEQVLDPYARMVVSTGERQPGRRGTLKRGRVETQEFDWQSVARPRIAPENRIVYELHVGGFTRSASSNVGQPGTYLGLIEKIPYLKTLGITTVELLPVFEFDAESINPGLDPEVIPLISNYWGYNPVSFFAPHAGYATTPGAQIIEMKTLVRELHRAGIEVVLDVVFNHTPEGRGGVEDPLYSFGAIDRETYYMVEKGAGRYLDYSGCFNTINTNHPVVSDLIIDSLRYWVAEMHVDGFRFDLASVFSRDSDGSVLSDPPILRRIARDPLIADRILIAEAWDAAGLYQVGNFPPPGVWWEWNGRFRDDIRRFVRGEAGHTGALATRLAGSSDLYAASNRRPYHSINFVTAHDGFTLADLVSYNSKHNGANGEWNRDGSDDNISWNCGIEGETDDEWVRTLRERQLRNHLTLLLLAAGTPMLLAGDECGRTQRGNNNPYCQDNDISWFDWAMVDRNAGLLRFARKLIALRGSLEAVRRTQFLTGRADGGPPDVSWHGVEVGRPDWSGSARALGMQLSSASGGDDLYLIANSADDQLRFELPRTPGGGRWNLLVDTARRSPLDITEQGAARPVEDHWVVVEPRSCVVLRSGHAP